MRPSDRPVFVVGCPRSGTTLFRTMLHAHPRIAVPPETRFVRPAYWNRYKFGDLSEPERRERLTRWITDREDSRFHVLGLDGRDVARQIMEAPPTIGSAVGVVFRAYSARFDKPRWGDKRPSYYEFMDELNHLFPDAQFIHLIRDGRACAASLKRQEWFSDDTVTCMAPWMMAIDSARESGARLPADRYVELRYEDLVLEPEKELRRICEFLDEDYHPAMVEPDKIAERVVPAGYEQRKEISQGVYTHQLDAWRTHLEPWEIATFESVAGDQLVSLGYELSGIGIPDEKKADELRAVHRQMRKNLAKKRGADARRLMDYDLRVAAELTSGQLAAATAEAPRRPLSSRIRRRVVPIPGRSIRLMQQLTRPLRSSAAQSVMDRAVEAADAVDAIDE